MSWLDDIADEMYEKKQERDKLLQGANDREGDPFVCAKLMHKAQELTAEIKSAEKLISGRSDNNE